MDYKKLLYLSLVVLLAACNMKPVDSFKEFSVKLVIDYGNLRETKESIITTRRQLTALEALQHASKVETHPVGNHVFVCSIDSVQNIRGVKAWYYRVNGKPPGILAINNKINNGDTVRWVYKKDVCSSKIKQE
ncbi:MAG: DUF4430 domain-containing protein [Bacteroidales bacterium]|nr:DUF4430 domain-containing protein [Bacteroidales bacterium]